MKSTAIVLAAGQGKRMNSKVQKQFLLIKGKPVLITACPVSRTAGKLKKLLLLQEKTV